jgi:hypothetical protein
VKRRKGEKKKGRKEEKEKRRKGEKKKRRKEEREKRRKEGTIVWIVWRGKIREITKGGMQRSRKDK